MDILYKRLQHRFGKTHTDHRIAQTFSEAALKDIGYMDASGKWLNSKYPSREDWQLHADQKEIISALNKYVSKTKVHFVYWLDKHNDTQEPKLEAPSPDEVNYLSFLYGGKGAVRHLAKQAEHEKELASNQSAKQTEVKVETKPAEIKFAMQPVSIEPVVLQQQTQQITNPALNKKEDKPLPLKMLQTVYVTSKSNKFGSGRTAAQINALGQQEVNDYFREHGDISPKEALKLIDKLVGRDDVAIKISEEDCETIIGKPVTQLNFNSVMPLLKLNSVSSYSIIKDKYGPDGGEVQLKSARGEFSKEERFIMAWFAKNKTMLQDDKTGAINGAEYKPVKMDGEEYMALTFNVSAETLAKYLPKLNAQELAELSGRTLEIKFKPEFTQEYYKEWKEHAFGEGRLGEGKLKYQHSDQTITMLDAKQLYSDLNSTYGYDLEAVNAELSAWKNVSIAGFKKQITEELIEKRDAKSDEENYLHIMADETTTKETKDKAEKDHEAQKCKVENQIEDTKDNIKYLEKFRDAHGKTEKGLITILAKAEKLKFAGLQLDHAILEGSKEKEIVLADILLKLDKEVNASIRTKFPQQRLEDIVKLTDDATHRYSKNMDITGMMAEHKQFIKDISDKDISLESLQRSLSYSTNSNEYYNKLNAGMNLNTLSGEGTSLTPFINFSNSDTKGKFDYKANANISSAFIFKNGATQVQKPLVEFDNYGQMKQNISLSGELHLNNRTGLEGASSYTNDISGKTFDASAMLKKHGENSNGWSAGMLTGYSDIAENKTIIPAGAKLDVTHKFMLTGSSLTANASAGYSPFASYEQGSTGKLPANYYDMNANLLFTTKRVIINSFMDHRGTDTKDGSAHFNVLTAGAGFNYKFNSDTKMGLNATLVEADGFNMTKLSATSAFKLFRLPTELYSSLLNMTIDMRGTHLQQQLLEIGLKLATPNGKTHLDLKHISQLSGNLNSYTPYSIGILRDIFNKGN